MSSIDQSEGATAVLELVPESAATPAGALQGLAVTHAHRLRYLVSAAQFFAGLRRNQGMPSLDLLAPFQQAREAMRALQEALSEGRLDEASSNLKKLSDDSARLQSLVFEVEADTSEKQLQSYLTDAHVLTTDVLCRLIEFYALGRSEKTCTRTKLMAVATALAKRDDLTAGQPEAIRRSLERRSVLRGTLDQTLDPDLLSRSAELRQRILALEDEVSLGSLRGEVHGFRDELGQALYTAMGLSEALALALNLELRAASLERLEIKPFASVVASLEEVTAHDLENLEDAATADTVSAEAGADADLLRALVQEIERELRQAVTAGTDQEKGFHLDLAERAAVAPGPEEAVLSALLVSSASCRTAVDRVARGIADSKRAGDDHPEAGALAPGLVQAAAQLERDLADSVQNAIIQGRMDRAKIVTRSIHRLSRGRLGLALLAQLPCNGQAADTEGEQAGLRQMASKKSVEEQLEAAVLMRDALTKDKHPQPMPLAQQSSHTIQPQIRARTPLLLALTAVGIACAFFHLFRMHGGKPASPADAIDAPVPINSAAPAKGTFMATTDMAWQELTEEQREEHVRQLWTEVQKLGYGNMMLMDTEEGLPLAYASAYKVTVFPRTFGPSTPDGLEKLVSP